MRSERWHQIETLYHRALELEKSRRTVFLQDECAGDSRLQDEVERLLAEEQQAGSFLEEPAVQKVARELAQDEPESKSLYLKPGIKLGQYEVREQIGRGGMGEVYRGYDSQLKRDVALKVLPDRFVHDGERLSRFRREAAILASLNHPNIAAIYRLEESGGIPALVMEYVRGETLQERIKRGPIPIDEALPIANQIAEALEAAHEIGIIHRDLKPANVKITPDGKVKVLDFGLAKAFAPETSRAALSDSPTLSMGATNAGVILGTAAYMPPEQARGLAVDRRADIWAFGVLLYEMLTGKRPFVGTTVSDTLAQVLRMEPEWNRVPAKTLRLLQRCLEKDPRKRLRDIGDAKLLLEERLPNVGSSRKSTIYWKVAAVALGMIALIAMWAPWRLTRPIEQRPALSLDVDPGPDALLLSASGPPVTLSPDGTRLVFVAQRTDAKSSLFIRRLDQPTAKEIAGTVGAYGPFFSPDGQWVGFFAEGKMRKVSIDGGDAIDLCDAPAGRGASWGDNDRIVAALDTNSGLYSVPAAGGSTVQVTQRDVQVRDSGHRWPQVLPGSKAVLFTTSSNGTDWREASIAVVSLQDGKTKILLDRVGMYGRYVTGGFLVYVSNGTLFGVRFDPDLLEVRGAPVALLEQVSYRPTGGSADLGFSRNGAVVYRSGRESGLLTVQWLDAAGKTEPVLSQPALYLHPHLSPDGGRLATTVSAGSTADIWVYDLQRNIPTRLTTGPSANTNPTWTPDGRYIVFRSEGGMSWTRADGAGEPQPLTESSSITIQYPWSFTPDGTRLALYEQNATGNEIRTVSVKSEAGQLRAGESELFLKLPSGNSYPSFSPDGRWIAYASTESGGYEVYVRAFPDNGARVRISTNGGSHPKWSRTRNELFYGIDRRIMVAAYSATGGSFIADKPTLWSERLIADAGLNTAFDLAVDGNRVIAFMPAEIPDEAETQNHVTLVENFLDELRRRIPE